VFRSQGNDLCAAVLLEHLGSPAVQARDSRGQTPVHVAASRESVDMLLLLLNYGPDLNAQDMKERTPLMLAASSGHTAVLGCVGFYAFLSYSCNSKDFSDILQNCCCRSVWISRNGIRIETLHYTTLAFIVAKQPH
jgi:ankyrin repeat protein